MERSLAAIFAAAATITLASLLVPHWARVGDVTIALAASIAYPAAALLWFSRGRISMGALHAVIVVGTTLVGVGVWLAGAGVGSATVAFLYVFVGLYTAHFFSPRVAAAHIGYAIVSYAVALGFVHERTAASEWLFVACVVVAAGVAVGHLSAEVRALALRDSLTGLGNRRAWEETLPRQLAMASRNRKPLCVAIIDIDGLKGLNDRDGHLAGDRLLSDAARAWAREVRASDLLARYGGDEFALLLPDCTIARAMEIVGRLEEVCQGVTFSTGVARWDGLEDGASLLRRADDALYLAKSQGGGRSVLAAGLVA